MADGQFQVYVSGATSTADDWFAAMGAPETDLPALNEDQKSAARKFDITEAEYARGVLTHDLGEKRQLRRGKLLGAYVSSMLDSRHSGYRLASLIRKGVDDVWIGKIEGAVHRAAIRIPLELADDLIDLGNQSALESLKRLIAAQLDVKDGSAAL